jgi:hypothetical protein
MLSQEHAQKIARRDTIIPNFDRPHSSRRYLSGNAIGATGSFRQ